MSVAIHLLGRPAIIGADGAEQPVRGMQTWALLARILLARRPPARRAIAAELFPEAEDPLGALRWCLAALRRALGSADALTGDPIAANLPEGTWVDLAALEDGTLDAEFGR